MLFFRKKLLKQVDVKIQHWAEKQSHAEVGNSGVYFTTCRYTAIQMRKSI